MIRFARILVCILLGLSLLLAANEIFVTPPLFTPTFEAHPALVGSWRTEDVAFTVLPNGSVSGRVGKASVANGRMFPNRSWFGRLVRWRTDYLVRGDLSGEMNTYRFTAALNLKAGSLQGALFVVGANGARPRALRFVKDR